MDLEVRVSGSRVLLIGRWQIEYSRHVSRRAGKVERNVDDRIEGDLMFLWRKGGFMVSPKREILSANSGARRSYSGGGRAGW